MKAAVSALVVATFAIAAALTNGPNAFAADAKSKSSKKAAPTKSGAAKSKKKTAAAKPTPKPSMLDGLKGNWIACRPSTNEMGEPLKSGPTLSLQDIYSQTSSNTYTWTVAAASDYDCKKIVSETRTTFDCAEMTPEMMNCQTTKREVRQPKGKWVPIAMVDHTGKDNSYTIKLTVAPQEGGETVEISITSDESEARETFLLKKSK